YFDFYNNSQLKDPTGVKSYIWTMPSDVVNGPTRYFYDANLKQVVFVADTARIPIWLKVTSDHGCVDSIMHYVRIEPDLTVFIPNVFRPLTGGTNGAVVGSNRTFKVAATGYQSIEIYVFNRWGQMVYKSNTTEGEGWDGKDMQTQQECQQDAYIYQINAVSFNNKKYTYSGSITLLR
ncbi:MAG: gliding motility-associated C-terminal domain-containing protein, partial [Bacteroidota bacterium]|nr:gliding motility-associated C-terminal domain-containing protein [Bacteroidota bacterium]